eukprot:7269242-Prymnesium_polylepis.1
MYDDRRRCDVKPRHSSGAARAGQWSVPWTVLYARGRARTMQSLVCSDRRSARPGRGGGDSTPRFCSAQSSNGMP